MVESPTGCQACLCQQGNTLHQRTQSHTSQFGTLDCAATLLAFNYGAKISFADFAITAHNFSHDSFSTNHYHTNEVQLCISAKLLD